MKFQAKIPNVRKNTCSKKGWIPHKRESSPFRNVGLQSVSRRCLYWLYEDVVAELLGEQVAYLLHVLELFHQLLQLVHVACHFHHLRL